MATKSSKKPAAKKKLLRCRMMKIRRSPKKGKTTRKPAKKGRC